MDEIGNSVPETVISRLGPVSTGPDMLRPSEYTALLLHALSMRADRIKNANFMEVGVGSGVVLAAAGQFGAAHLTGVDVEPLAVWQTMALLADVPDAPPHRVVQGDMWAPFSEQRFDMIVANLPHFPVQNINQPTRMNSWSNGGSDGRLRIDQFFGGLSEHLMPNGLALLVHSAFTDLDLSRATLAEHKLEMRPILTTLIQIETGKLKALSPAIRARLTGVELKQYGSYVFSLTHVMEITQAVGPESVTAL